MNSGNQEGTKARSVDLSEYMERHGLAFRASKHMQPDESMLAFAAAAQEFAALQEPRMEHRPNTDALKACPFCGCTGCWGICENDRSAFWMECAVCHARGPRVELEGMAKPMWNRRKTPNASFWDEINNKETKE